MNADTSRSQFFSQFGQADVGNIEDTTHDAIRHCLGQDHAEPCEPLRLADNEKPTIAASPGALPDDEAMNALIPPIEGPPDFLERNAFGIEAGKVGQQNRFVDDRKRVEPGRDDIGIEGDAPDGLVQKFIEPQPLLCLDIFAGFELAREGLLPNLCE